MTQDFIEDFRQALEREGYEYVILTWKDLGKGASINTNVRSLDETTTWPSGRSSTKRDDLMELMEFTLKD